MLHLQAAERAPLGQEALGEEGAAGPAGRKTLETVTAADSIVEALDLAASEEERAEEARAAEERRKRRAAENGEAAPPAPAPVPANPMLLGRSPSEHVLAAVARVRGAELEQALLLLPFADALRLLHYVLGWLRAGGAARVELLCRLAALLVRLHMAQLTATPSARPVLVELQQALRARAQGFKDLLGFNLAAMEHLQRELRDRQAHPADPAAAVQALKRRRLEAADKDGGKK